MNIENSPAQAKAQPEKPAIKDWFSDHHSAWSLGQAFHLRVLSKGDIYTLCSVVEHLRPSGLMKPVAMKAYVLQEIDGYRERIKANYRQGDDVVIKALSHLHARLRFSTADDVALWVFFALLAISQPPGSNKLIFFNSR